MVFLYSGGARKRRLWKRDKAENCLQIGYPGQKHGEEYFTSPLISPPKLQYQEGETGPRKMDLKDKKIS